MLVDKLHWLGHSGFRIDGSKTVYFDPYQLAGRLPKADIVCITHDHFDHCSLDDVRMISTKNTLIVTDRTVSRQLKSSVLDCKEIKPLSPGDNIDISGIQISGVASYNIGKQFHSKDSNRLGFILSMDGVRFYHAGDTDLIPEMKDYRCDVALLPVSGTYVMTADEAAEAVLLIKPKVAIPMHYGTTAGSLGDAIRFQNLLSLSKVKVEVKILKKETRDE